MSIIDFHVHIFPDKIAEKATRAVGKFYDIPMAKFISRRLPAPCI